MVKIYLTFGKEEPPEGFERKLNLEGVDPDSVDELRGNCYLEKVPSLVILMAEVWRALKVGGTAEFFSQYYTHAAAYLSPLVVRSISELSLNFVSKDWRESAKYDEVPIDYDFDLMSGLSLDPVFENRSDETRTFAQRHYLNSVPSIQFKCTKK